MQLLDCDLDPTVLSDRHRGEQPAGGLAGFRRRMLHEIAEVDSTPLPVLRLDRFRKSKDEILLVSIAEMLSRYGERWVNTSRR
jgi:hypothetical protein